MTGEWEVRDEEATSEMELSYEELARLIGEDHVLRLYLEDVTPAGATRRVAGFLCLRADAGPSAPTSPADIPDIPF